MEAAKGEESNNRTVVPDAFEIMQMEDKPLKFNNFNNQLARIESEETGIVRGLQNEELKLEIEYFYKHAIIAAAIHFTHFILGPISIPLLWFLFGKHLCLNMGFGFHRFYLVEFIPWTWILMTLIYFVQYYTQFQIFTSLILATFAIVLLKTSLVSVKYGFYTESLWKQMKRERVEISILQNQLILRGWMVVPTAIIKDELLKSIGRLNRSPDELCVTFESEVPREFKEIVYKCKAGFNLEIHHERSVHQHQKKDCIPAFLFAKMMIEYTVPRSHCKKQSRLVDLLNITYAISPIISIIIQFGTDKLSFGAFEIFYTIFSLMLCLIFSRVFLYYILIGIIDMRRRMFLMNQCSALLTNRESHDSILKEHHLPKLDFTDMRTIDSWYIMRAAFLDFGRSYTYRIFVYASLILPLSCFIILALILQFFGIISFISIPAMIAVIVLTFSSLLLIVFMIMIGSKINDMFSVHRDLIINICSDSLHLKRSEDPNDANVYQALNLVNHKLEQDEILRPVMIMGFKADSAFLSKLFTIIGSGLLSVFQVAFNSSSYVSE